MAQSVHYPAHHSCFSIVCFYVGYERKQKSLHKSLILEVGNTSDPSIISRRSCAAGAGARMEEIGVKAPPPPLPRKENASQGWNQDPGASSDSTRLRPPPSAATWRSFPQAAGGESEFIHAPPAHVPR